MKPLREHFHGPPVEVVIRLTEEDRADLGKNPSARASTLVRAVLAEKRRRRLAEATAQLRLGFVPKRRARRE